MIKKQGFKLLTVFFAFLIHSNFIFAWQVWLGQPPHKFSSGIALIDPDKWSREELAKLKIENVKTIAWLNVSQIEPERLITDEIKEKSLIINKRYHPKWGKLARFYGAPFKAILKQRIREYIEKGFSGFLLARPFYYKSVSNSPINKLEMIKLISELYSEIKSLDPSQIVLVHNSFNLFEEISQKSLIDGIVIEGLFNAKHGKHKHPWDRNKTLLILKKWRSNQKLVICVDDARKPERQEFIKKECKKYKFETAFIELPISLKGRIKKWWKEKK